MIKLIKLEMKKYRMKGYIRSAVIANLIIIAFMMLIYYGSKTEKEIPFKSFNEVFLISNILVRGTFVCFAGVIISRIIIGEFTSKTVNVMFLYPINRKRLIASKLIFIVIFTFTSMIIANITTAASICIADNFSNYVPGKLSSEVIHKNLIMFFVNSIAFTGISLIPLYFGMRRKSIQVTIISSILIVFVLCSTTSGGFSMGSIIAIPTTLAIIGVIVAYLAISDIEHKDITN